jgi:transposase
MTQQDPGRDRLGRRAKRFLSPSEKYELWLQLVTGELSQSDAAERFGVDHSTVMRIRQVAKQGALEALAASKPGVRQAREDAELAAARAESSPWTSSTLACRASWSRSRAFSAARRVFSRISGSVGGRPRRCCNACNAPLVTLLAPLGDQRGVQALAPEQRALAGLAELLVLGQDPQLVGGRVLAWRPGPLGDFGVGHLVHTASLRPQLGGGHRGHRSADPLSPSTHLFQ